MTPDPAALAALHARAFAGRVPPPWSAAAIAAALADPSAFLLAAEAGASRPPSRRFLEPMANPAASVAGASDKDEGQAAGFLIGRAAAGEAELLTLAVEPALQGRGIGGRLVAEFLAGAAARGAGRAFLEVAAGNAAARAVYARAGFVEVGRRRGYYGLSGGGRQDALVMARDLAAPVALS